MLLGEVRTSRKSYFLCIRGKDRTHILAKTAIIGTLVIGTLTVGEIKCYMADKKREEVLVEIVARDMYGQLGGSLQSKVRTWKNDYATQWNYFVRKHEKEVVKVAGFMAKSLANHLECDIQYLPDNAAKKMQGEYRIEQLGTYVQNVSFRTYEQAYKAAAVIDETTRLVRGAQKKVLEPYQYQQLLADERENRLSSIPDWRKVEDFLRHLCE